MPTPDSATLSAEHLKPPLVSVVIIGRNEGERLGRCIVSIQSIEGINGSVELIYVDSNSTDGSALLACEAGARVFEVDSSTPTAALGRNIGWKASHAEFILFLDGDTILHPMFLRRALDAIVTDPMIAAVWGHRREIHGDRSIYNRVLDLDWVYAHGFTDYCGGDVLMRRPALQMVDGYDAELIAGEEPELCGRLRSQGYRILHIDAPMTGHDLAMFHLGQYWKRALRAGHAYAEVSQRFRDTPDQFWKPQRNHNFVRGGFWSLTLALATACSLLFRAALPVGIWTALLLVLAARTAWLARWKSRSVITLFFYGVHSHLQQIPILLGQLQYARDKRNGSNRKLIEYKN
jgi:glycosyltransferase involved in cell wall biosynthesis